MPTHFDAAAIYDDGYFEGERWDGYSGYAGSESVLRREFRASVGRLAQFALEGSRLLELGCAYGFFLLEARARFDVLGVEVSDAAVAEAQRRGLPVLQGDVSGSVMETLETQNASSFGAVVMRDVIEHLAEPRSVLRRAAGLLREGGVLFLTTGDANSAFARLMGRHWRLMTPPQHLYFFSRSGLERMLQEEGFKIVGVRRPWKLVPLGLALFQGLRCVAHRPNVPRWLGRIGLPVNLFDTVEIVAIRECGVG